MGISTKKLNGRFYQTVAALEWKMIEEALGQAKGNKAEAARILEINRTSLIEKIRSFGRMDLLNLPIAKGSEMPKYPEVSGHNLDNG